MYKRQEKDGATWLRTTEFGDDKDRVVIKSDGQPAYIAGDLAYYLDKRERGYARAIILLGADRHGDVAGPAFFRQGPLNVDGGAHRRRRGTEHGEEFVGPLVDHVSLAAPEFTAGLRAAPRSATSACRFTPWHGSVPWPKGARSCSAVTRSRRSRRMHQRK